MPHPTLEQRLATLESQFQELRNGRSDVQPTGWRHAVESMPTTPICCRSFRRH